ncbi:hypothetical protein [uncultured Umboniibacter sp.]|uniref:hypothetical protein n=1 Tax=uncultured Umboniibacter sp. TaxID=1798917 RepID=UPI0026141376|nr:hypothetical protein [uncultured Umboniibacter sp.]
MDSFITPIFIAIAFLVIGVVVGYLTGINKAQQTTSIQPEKPITDPTAELRRDLATYFDHMAAATAELNRQGETLQSQLIDSAQQIANINLTSHFDGTKPSLSHAEPPRDWAPKSANAVGTLSEEYGLKDEPVEPPRI